LPFLDSRRAIHLQQADRGPAHGGQAEDLAIAKLIVAVPAVNAWIKQWRELSGLEIYRSDVTAFEPVADRAAQSEVFPNCLAAVRHCNHVINLVLREREAF
jgi:hypothetical protein